MHTVLFEDLLVPQLHPITLARPAYAISCGAYRWIDWIDRLPYSRQGLVRPHLEELQRIDYPQLASPAPDPSTDWLLINARAVPSVRNFESVRQLAELTRSGIVRDENGIAAVRFAEAPVPPIPESLDAMDALLQSDLVAQLPKLDIPLALFRYPHDVIHANQEILTENLEYRLKGGEFREIADGVFAAEGARLGEHVVCNTAHGPILLDRDASVGPFSYLAGPAYVGPASRLIEHAAIKDAVSIGHTVKIGGEIEASVIEPYTNKQHYGFLGHSYLGSWINLGAGTCNSDLKNTYGTINMEYPFGRVATGRQFVGCIIGDYSKSAINTGIFTGKTIGVCSMMYGFVTTNVPSFVNYARLFGQVTELPPEVMIATQQRMFQRRSVTPRPCDVQLIRDMYEITRSERQTAGEQLSL